MRLQQISTARHFDMHKPWYAEKLPCSSELAGSANLRRERWSAFIRIYRKYSLLIREFETERRSRWEVKRRKGGADGSEKLTLVPNEYLSHPGVIAFSLLPCLSKSPSRLDVLSGNASRKDSGAKQELQLLLFSFHCLNISTLRTSENPRCHSA